MATTRRHARTRRIRVLAWVLLAGAVATPAAVDSVRRHPAQGAVVLIVFGSLGAVAVKRCFPTRRRSRRQPLRRKPRTLTGLYALDPTAFEHRVADLCRRSGCRDVRQVGGAGDLGADVLGRLPDGRLFVIQCKRYGPGHKVGSRDMQCFGGTCWQVHQAQVAALVTTSSFTDAAAGYATRSGILTVDGAALNRWVSGGVFPLR